MDRITRARVHSPNAQEPDGLKGYVFEQEYAPVSVFAGPNGGGKTTVGILPLIVVSVGLAPVATDTVRPDVGGLPRNTALTVDVETPDGIVSLTRDLGVWKGSAHVAANAAAKELIGSLPCSWNLDDFARATPGSRAKVLQAVARAGGAIEFWDVAKAQARVREIMEGITDENDRPVSLTPLDEAIDKLTEADDGAIWLEAAERWAVDEQKRANAEQKAGRAAAAGVAAEEHPEPDVGADADAARRAEIDARRAELAHLDEARRLAQSSRDRAVAEVARLAKALDQLQAEGERLKTPTPPPAPVDLGPYRARIAEAEAALDAPPPEYTGPTVAQAQAELEAAVRARDEAATVLETARGARDASNSALETARAALQTAQQHVATADGIVSSAQANVETLEAIHADGICVDCGSTDPLRIHQRLEEARAVLVQATTAREAAVLQQTRAAESKTAAVRAAADAEKLHNDAKSVHVSGISVVTVAEQHLSTTRAAIEGYAARVKARRTADLERVRAELRREEERIARLDREHTDAEERRTESLTATRRRWKATDDQRKAAQVEADRPLPEPADETERATLAADLAKIEARDAQRRDVEAWRVRLRLALSHADDLVAYWDGSRGLVTAVRCARAEMAAKAYGPIELAARELLHGSGLVEPYFRGPADYGAVVEGRGAVPLAGLSGSQRVIVAASLVYALAVVSRQPCPMALLDELDRIVSISDRRALVQALVAAQKAGRVGLVSITLACADDDPLDYLADLDGVTIYRRHVEPARHPRQLVDLVATPVEDEPDEEPEPEIVPAPVVDTATEDGFDDIPF